MHFFILYDMKKVMLFDISNLMMRCLFAFKYGPQEKDFDMTRNTFIKSFIKTISDNNPDKVICCLDNSSWRKEAMETYKENRKAFRAKSIIDFEAFFAVSNRIISGLRECMPNIQFLDVPRCEADDLIAVITKHYQTQYNVINISTDHDFYQLFKYPNYKQYDGMMHSFVEVLNPEQELLMKIILGDKGDNVPKLKAGVGIKTAHDIIEKGLDEWLDKENLRERFEQNTKLISFDCIPSELVTNIKNEVDNFVPGKFNGVGFQNFIINEGLSEIFERVNEYKDVLKKV